MNILIYPLYLIGNNKDHFERHEEIVNINIEVVKSFNCVDDIRIVGKPVVNWSEMINDFRPIHNRFSNNSYELV